MTVGTLINGIACDTVSANDRGLQYGDGIFRTLLLQHGEILHWRRHYAKLSADCSAINIPCPGESLLHEELSTLLANTRSGVVKIIITRGNSQRGYNPVPSPETTRILSLHPAPNYPDEYGQLGVKLHLCQLRLSHQPRLAGIKHLNRLENVLATAELNAPDIAEGLLLDEADFVIGGVRSNLFLVKSGNIFTPDLSRCGVAGMQRERVMARAQQQGISCRIIDVSWQELLQADEVFLSNSIIGIWPVREMPGYYREHFPIAQAIKSWIEDERD